MKFFRKNSPWLLALIGLSLTVFYLKFEDRSSRGGEAGCIIDVNHSIILVRDVWSSRLSLPGGGVRLNETPVEAVERHTFEQTGIPVRIGKFLTVTEGRYFIYECKPKDQKIPINGGNTLAFPPAAFNEISEVVLVNIDQLEETKWKFQSQKNIITQIFNKNLIEKYNKIVRADISPNWLEQTELNWIEGFQSNLSSVFLQVCRIFSFFSSETFFLLLLPAFWFGFNRRLGVEAVLLFCFSTMVQINLKQGLMTYRPFHFVPTLKLEVAEGYGMPAESALLSTVYWGFLALHLNFKRKWQLVALISFVCGFSTVILGVHFIHDVVLGWVVGGLILFGYLDWTRKMKNIVIGQKTWALLLTGASVSSLLLRFHPEVVSILALLLGMVLGIQFLPLHEIRRWVVFRLTRQRWALPVAVLVILGIQILYQMLEPLEAGFLICFFYLWLKYFSLGLWMGLLPNLKRQQI